MEKEFKNIDDLLRDSLSNLEQKPSGSVWEKISTTLPGYNYLGLLYSKVFWLILAGIVTVVVFLFLNRPSTLTENNPGLYENLQFSNNETQDLVPENITENSGIMDSNENKLEAGNQNETISIEVEDGSKNHSGLTSVDRSNDPEIKVKEFDNLVAESQMSNPNVNNQITGKYLITGYYPFLVKRTFDDQIYQNYSVIIRPNHIEVRKSILNFNLPGQKSVDDYGKKQNLFYGVHLTPELIFPGTGQTNKGIGFELTGRYLIKDIYLETGLGVNISEDDGNFTINYEQYDSIGYYYKVLSFTIDESSGVPVFNTDLEAVFDTVEYSTSEVKHNTYTYLYLPLYAGVKMYEYKRLNLNLQTGIIYSILINSQEPLATYTNDKATQISITNENPAKISSNWQMVASLGIQYQLNQSLSLNIEPVFKYYFKPEYERRDNPNSKFGTGLRIGIYVKF